ncbi:MAG: RNA-binding S4 domain-containing protein [Pseudomonadota bacterium]
MPEAEAEDIRLDVWLWRARFFRTRALATDYIDRRGVRLTRSGQTRKTDKPGQRIKPGDVLTFYKAKSLETVEVLSAGTRRGPAAEAQDLYKRLSDLT